VRTTIFVALACCAYAGAAEPGPADVFEQLQSLVGQWEAELPGFGKIRNSIRLVSNGKAIEETIGTSADNEVSIYTRDGDRVSLTHFCALTPDGHVVRLATGHLKGTQDHLEFVFLAATNLHRSAAPHMRRVLTTFTDRDHFSEKWTKTEAGKDTVFELHFARQVWW
jgi:hypothetical protein